MILSSVSAQGICGVSPALLDRLTAAGVFKPPLEYEKAHTYPASQPFFEEMDAVQAFSALPAAKSPFWVYIHVPYCNYKCSFCFYRKTHSRHIESQFPTYYDSIDRELQYICRVSGCEKLPTHDLYIGGGTPTALEPQRLRILLKLVESVISRTGDFLGSCECSPESVTEEKCSVLLDGGITRISLGGQSLEQHYLDATGRLYRVEEICKAYGTLRRMGCDHLNLDLIYGFPGQSPAEWERDLRVALATMRPESFTLYYLRYVPGTPLARHAQAPDRASWPDLVAMRQIYFALLSEAGYEMCRPHHFRLPAERVREYRGAPTLDHGNTGSQIGLGPSAYSHVGGCVSRNSWPISRWLRAIQKDGFGTAEGRILTQEDRATRLIVKSLTGSFRVDRELLREEVPVVLGETYEAKLKYLAELGLLEESPGGYHLTELGILLDEEVAYFLYPSGFQAASNPMSVGSPEMAR